MPIKTEPLYFSMGDNIFNIVLFKLSLIYFQGMEDGVKLLEDVHLLPRMV